MSTNLLPPNSCLVAILLVVRTTPEPRLVFHYPPKPGEDNARFQNLVREDTEDDTSTTSSDDAESSGEEAALLRDAQAIPQMHESPPGVDEVGSISPDKYSGFPEEATQAEWNDMFGYRAGVLAKLLCPPETSHKKRVEIGLEGRVFVGQPAFAALDGEWRKKRRSSSKGAKPDYDVGASVRGLNQSLTNGDTENMVLAENRKVHDSSTDMTAETQEAAEDQENETNHTTQAVSGSKKIFAAAKKKPKTSLNMFHISFILDPPPLEYHLRVKEIYDHVVRKLAKALRWEQARSDYVAKEVSTITTIVKRSNKVNGRFLQFSQDVDAKLAR